MQDLNHMTEVDAHIVLEKLMQLANKTDWPLLVKQKNNLILSTSFQEKILDKETKDGLINFLDSIQDFFCDDLGLGEDIIFNTSQVNNIDNT